MCGKDTQVGHFEVFEVSPTGTLVRLCGRNPRGAGCVDRRPLLRSRNWQLKRHSEFGIAEAGARLRLFSPEEDRDEGRAEGLARESNGLPRPSFLASES
jgi:hypothetical protein